MDDEPADRTSRGEATAGDAGISAWRIKELGSRVLTARRSSFSVSFEGRLFVLTYAFARPVTRMFHRGRARLSPGASPRARFERSSRVAGPVLHAPAAQGALAVTQMGTAGPGRYMAFGDGSVVDVTNDGGKHWWRAGLGEEVPAVIASGGN